MAFRLDPDIDITAIRIGKSRVARRKDNKLSDVKQAILLQRAQITVVEPASSDVLDTGEMLAPVVDTTVATSAPYSDYTPTEILDELSFRVLKELARLQAKGNQQPPEKRYRYKRFVAGIREVHRALLRGDLKGIIVASNLEAGVDILNDLMVGLKQDAIERNIPFIVALNKRRLGKALNKSMKQSVVGITNLDGVYQEWRSILAEVHVLSSPDNVLEATTN